MEKKAYTEMNNNEKAQAIYNYMVENQSEELDKLLLELSRYYDKDEAIFGLVEWVEEYQEYGPMFELLQIAQQSKDLDLNDEYIRTSIYYYGYTTSDSVINLVDEYKAVEWIARTLGDRYKVMDNLNDMDKIMQIKFG